MKEMKLQQFLIYPKQCQKHLVKNIYKISFYIGVVGVFFIWLGVGYLWKMRFVD
jgi:hypothetical protein